MREINLDEEYNYLGGLKAGGMKNKKNEREKCCRRVREILKSRLNRPNTITVINFTPVSIVKDSAGIIKGTKAELGKMDRKTTTLMTAYQALHPQADVNRLYVKSSMEGRGLTSSEI